VDQVVVDGNRVWHGPLHAWVTPKQRQVLQVMLRGRGGLATTTDLYEALYGDQPEVPESNVIAVHVMELRRRLYPLGLGISRSRKVGYRLYQLN
jgi:DNA-binding response OmpR family regulator